MSGKGANKSSRPKRFTKNPKSGKEVCFAYNDSQCSDASCQREHCCEYCLGQHPKYPPDYPFYNIH